MAEQRFRLVGDADMLAAPGIAEDLDKVIDACGDDLVIDCTGLEFIDSSGIGVLVNARNTLDGQGRKLRIVNMTPIGRRAIDGIGLPNSRRRRPGRRRFRPLGRAS
jgi:anti-anti-sigma factor